MLVIQIVGLLEALLPKSAIEDKAVTQYSVEKGGKMASQKSGLKRCQTNWALK